MNPTLLLRIAAGVCLLTAIGHTLGAPWTPATGTAASAVIGSMKALQFSAMGTDRTYWDFYYGFGVSISVYLFAQAIVLWQIAAVAKSAARQMRPMMLTFLASNLISGAITWKYFFAAPLILTFATAACIIAAWLAAGRRTASA